MERLLPWYITNPNDKLALSAWVVATIGNALTLGVIAFGITCGVVFALRVVG